MSQERTLEILECFDYEQWLIYAEIRHPYKRKPTVHELQSLKRRGLVGYRPGWVSDSSIGRWALTPEGMALLDPQTKEVGSMSLAQPAPPPAHPVREPKTPKVTQ